MAKPGDVGFVARAGFLGWWIKYAQHHKYGKHNTLALWNHVFMVTGNDQIIEAKPHGVELNHLADYAHQETILLRPNYALGGADIAVSAMFEMLYKDERYGWLTLLSCALSLMTGTRMRFGIDGTEICSGAVSYALTRANIDVGDDGEFNTPADLATYAEQQNWSIAGTATSDKI